MKEEQVERHKKHIEYTEGLYLCAYCCAICNLEVRKEAEKKGIDSLEIDYGWAVEEVSV